MWERSRRNDFHARRPEALQPRDFLRDLRGAVSRERQHWRRLLERHQRLTLAPILLGTPNQEHGRIDLPRFAETVHFGNETHGRKEIHLPRETRVLPRLRDLRNSCKVHDGVGARLSHQRAQICVHRASRRRANVAP